MEKVLSRHTADHIQQFLTHVQVAQTSSQSSSVSSLGHLYELSVGLASRDYLLSRVRMNDIFDIDDHLIGINAQLMFGQSYIGCADSLAGYDTKVFVKKSLLPAIGLRQAAFMFHRVLPKLSWGQRLYRWIMKGRKKRMCKTEILGRLAYAGFGIEQIEQHDNILYYRVVKKSEPLQGYSPTFGPLIKLKRVVKGGKKVNIYKLRTMHPYAEFIQDYVYEQNDLDVGGKIRDDFRVSEEGRLFRKYFLDELPMLINLIKGDIKLVGVRPLSEHYLGLYTDAIRNKRLKFKPGLFPPYYSEPVKPANLEEVMISEMRYLLAYEKHPIRTDIKYFFKIVNNILRKKLRSK